MPTCAPLRGPLGGEAGQGGGGGVTRSERTDHAAAWRAKRAAKRAARVGSTGAVVAGGGVLARGAVRAGAHGAAPGGLVDRAADDDNERAEALAFSEMELSGDGDGDDDEDVHPDAYDPTRGGREMCWRCRRVARLCVCGLVRSIVGDAPVPHTLGITVLQDRKEALKRPFGSAIVAELVLENCTSVWYDTKVPERVPRPPHLPAEGVGVLFPGPNALPLRRPVGGGDEDGTGDAPDERPPPTHLIVIDTTWHRARRMYNRIPWVKDLPCYVLGEHTPLVTGKAMTKDPPREPTDYSPFDSRSMAEMDEEPVTPLEGSVGEFSAGSEAGAHRGRRESGYRIRKQPKPGFLSTAECIAAALREAEPGFAGEDGGTAPGLGSGSVTGETRKEGAGLELSPGERAARAVETCFDAMIEAQVRSVGERKSVRYRSRKRERWMKKNVEKEEREERQSQEAAVARV